jgi:hypothetical protein
VHSKKQFLKWEKEMRRGSREERWERREEAKKDVPEVS